MFIWLFIFVRDVFPSYIQRLCGFKYWNSNRCPQSYPIARFDIFIRGNSPPSRCRSPDHPLLPSSVQLERNRTRENRITSVLPPLRALSLFSPFFFLTHFAASASTAGVFCCLAWMVFREFEINTALKRINFLCWRVLLLGEINCHTDELTRLY